MKREELLKKITLEAGKETLKLFNKKDLKKKSKAYEGDFVTEADILSHNLITEAIKRNFPNDGIISEEDKDYCTDAEYLWIIDPIDGTFNFASNIPIFAVIIGLAKNKEMIAGAIYFPYMKDLYYAEKGKSAFLNNKKIHCASKSNLDNARTTGYIIPVKGLEKELIRINMAFSKSYCWNTEFGCGAYDTMLLASGKSHCFIAPPSSYGGVWDLAAPAIILREAGCKVTNMRGKEWNIKDGPQMIAANPEIHKKIMKIIK
jgi:myo-inositol-1(or 4)-monophosphatase